MTELGDVYEAADANYRESLRFLGDSLRLVQDILDVYQRTADVVASSPRAHEDEHVMGMNFMMAARYYGVMALLACLRGHITDSFASTRMAIEAAAFAFRVKRHPNLARVWLDAGEDDAAYDEYRKRFRRLFPEDHARLRELGARYDLCAKQTHPSVYAFAGRSKVDAAEPHYTLKFEYFQMASDGSEPARTFLFTLNTHILILGVFGEALGRALSHDPTTFDLRFNAVEAALAQHTARWIQRVPALRPTGT